MPFRLREYDQAFAAFVHEAVHGLAVARSPMLGMLRHESLPTTVGSRIQTRDGIDLDLPPTEAGFGMSTSVDAVRSGDVVALIAEFDRASDELGRRLVEMFVDTMREVTDATGNVVDAGGKLTFDVFYEMLEKMEFGLDENDELVMPTIVAHPTTAEKLTELRFTPEQEQMLRELRERKKEEALARRRRRRLS